MYAERLILSYAASSDTSRHHITEQRLQSTAQHSQRNTTTASVVRGHIPNRLPVGERQKHTLNLLVDVEHEDYT